MRFSTPRGHATFTRFLLVLCFVAVAAGCSPQQPSTLRAEAETFIGLQLPAGAWGVRIADEAGIDRLVRLRFDASEAEADRFTAKLLPAGLAHGFDPGLVMLASDLDWWLQTVPSQAEGGERNAAANKTYKLVSMAIDPATRRVWLAVFTR